VVAVLDFYNYVTRLDSSTLLIWNQKKGTPYGGSPPVHLIVIRPKSLPSFGENLAKEILRMETEGTRLALSDQPVAAIDLNTGVAGEDVVAVFPKVFQAVEELLILCNSSAVERPKGMNIGLALLVARPKQGIFRLYPQDWYNFADLDFGYQWVTRVARDTRSGKVFGEGFRIDPFELDDTLCNIVKTKSSANQKTE
jgi:hypothetical protein